MRGKVDLRKVLSRVEDQRQHNRFDINSSSEEMLQIFWANVLSLSWISDGFDVIDNQKVKMRKRDTQNFIEHFSAGYFIWFN